MIELTPVQIENWVSSHFKYKKRSGGRQLVINNPFDGDSGYHFWISTVKSALKQGKNKGKVGYWVFDFRPGVFAGSLINFVMKYRKLNYFQAIQELTGLKRGDLKSILRQDFRKKQEIEKEEEEEKCLELPKFSKILTEESDNSKIKQIALNYLHNRAINNEKIQHYSLYYTPVTIVFPYVEYGLTVYWQERELLNKKFNFPDAIKTGLNKTDFVFGFDHVDPNDDVVIVESIFNCMSIGHNCIASGGATISGKQPLKISALSPRTLILAPDFDEAGLKSLIGNYYLLKNKFKLAYCLPPSVDDWNDMDKNNGIGTALRYIEKNVKYLNLSELVKVSNLLALLKAS